MARTMQAAAASWSLTSVSTTRAPFQQGKRCERRPVWGPQVSGWCYPSGVCNNLVIKYYEDVCE